MVLEHGLYVGGVCLLHFGDLLVVPGFSCVQALFIVLHKVSYHGVVGILNTMEILLVAVVQLLQIIAKLLDLCRVLELSVGVG